MKDVTTDTPNQPPGPAHQCAKCRFLALEGKSLEQLSVALLGGRWDESVNVPQHGAGRRGGHDPFLPRKASTIIVPEAGGIVRDLPASTGSSYRFVFAYLSRSSCQEGD
jgi:hypothetical protein